MNYLGIDKASINNGPGVRVVLWVSGCTVRCKGCQNPESWNFNAGKLFGIKAQSTLFEYLSKPYIKGITFSGGNPLEYKNLPYVYNVIFNLKRLLPEKDIWLYTGFDITLDDFDSFKNRFYNLPHGHYLSSILHNCDVIVDGPYVEEQRDITLKFRGSKNQRLIDVKETLKQGEIVTTQN